MQTAEIKIHPDILVRNIHVMILSDNRSVIARESLTDARLLISILSQAQAKVENGTPIDWSVYRQEFYKRSYEPLHKDIVFIPPVTDYAQRFFLNCDDVYGLTAIEDANNKASELYEHYLAYLELFFPDVAINTALHKINNHWYDCIEYAGADIKPSVAYKKREDGSYQEVVEFTNIWEALTYQMLAITTTGDAVLQYYVQMKCKRCGKSFIAESRKYKFCDDCRYFAERERKNRSYYRCKEREAEQNGNT